MRLSKFHRRVLDKMKEGDLYGVYEPMSGRRFSVKGMPVSLKIVNDLSSANLIRRVSGKEVGLSTVQYTLNKEEHK